MEAGEASWLEQTMVDLEDRVYISTWIMFKCYRNGYIPTAQEAPGKGLSIPRCDIHGIRPHIAYPRRLVHKEARLRRLPRSLARSIRL